MQCPKCGYKNLDGAAVCNLCGELLHHGGHAHFRSAPPVRSQAPPAVGGGMAPGAPPPGPPLPAALDPDLKEIRHCLVCFPLDPVKLDKKRVYDIGRSSKCAIILPVGMVSRHHARIAWEDGVFALTDLRSSNGTRVNGETVSRHALRNRDQIRIGPYLLEYYIYAGDTNLVTDRHRELEKTKDITIGDPTHSINTFQGNVSEMALGEIMQLLNLTRKSGNLRVHSGDEEGTVFFRRGEIVHAQWMGREGEDALGPIVRITDGSFRFSLDEAEVPRTVERKTSKVLVEALRSARKTW